MTPKYFIRQPNKEKALSRNKVVLEFERESKKREKKEKESD